MEVGLGIVDNLKPTNKTYFCYSPLESAEVIISSSYIINKKIMINLSLHCCVLNSHKCSTPILGEIVRVTLKPVAVVTGEPLNLSTIFVFKPEFRNLEKISLFPE